MSRRSVSDKRLVLSRSWSILVCILSRCFLLFSGQDIMLPIACAVRSFWLEGQSTTDHWQNVTTDPWHYSYDFESGKRKRFEYYSWFILLVPRSDLQPESLCLFRYGQCVFTDDGETRTFCFRNTRETLYLCLFQEFSYAWNTFEFLLYYLFSVSLSFRNVNLFRQRGEICETPLTWLVSFYRKFRVDAH